MTHDPVTPIRSHALQSGETLVSHRGVTGLRYARRDHGGPLFVFLPGGGHLARIAYGHEGCDRSDFLDHWLGKAGADLIALSYPSDHAIFDGAGDPQLTIHNWARFVAAEIAGHAPAAPVVLLLWSMAGRSAAALVEAFRMADVPLGAILSLAATPPLPGLLPPRPGGEPMTGSGYWALAPGPCADARIGWFDAAVAVQEAALGRPIFPAGVYHRLYLCNTPIGLRGTPQGKGDADLAIDRWGSGGRPPFVGMLIPQHALDAAHALRDRASWSMLNALTLHARACPAHRPADSLPASAWQTLLAIERTMAERLSRSAEGGHLFFVGRHGARAASEQLFALVDEIRDLELTLF